MPNWQVREVKMVDVIYALIAGFGLGFVIMYYIATNLLNDVNAQLRLWRRDAIRLDEELMTLKETSR